MTRSRRYPLAIAIVLLAAPVSACSGSEDPANRIFVSQTPPGTAGLYDAGGSLVFLKSYPPGC